MKKTLIASAIAAAIASGSVQAQVTQTASDLAARMDSMPTVYGNIQYVLYHDNIDGGESAVEHADNGSTLGVMHDHDFAPGLTGFFKIEVDRMGVDDISTESSFRIDEAYIGVRGENFGQIWAGTDDTIYELAVTEISEFYEVAFLSRFVDYDTGEGDMVQYLSPSFGGLTVGAAVQINGDGDSQVDKKSYPWQLAAMYEVDALELAFAVDSNDGGRAYDGFNRVPSPNNENTYGFRASYNMDNLRLTGEAHTRKDVSDTFGVMGVYTLGKNQFALSYELTQYDDEFTGQGSAELAGNDVDTVTLQALHNLSDHMYVYFEGYLGTGDDGVYDVVDKSERSVASVGAVYYF